MALTTFAALTQPEKLTWARQTIKMARNASFVEQYVGKDANSIVQRVTEFSKTEKGAKAQIHLVSDLVNDGAAGDTQLWDSEEALIGSFQTIQIDQLRNANRLSGRMNDQKMVINFREQSRDVLAYWLADRTDQAAFLTMSGMDYRLKLNGAIRTGFSYSAGAWARTAATGMSLYDLSFASDVTAPSANRGFRWVNSTKSLAPTAVASMVSGDTISYATIVALKMLAKEKYIRGVKPQGGLDEEYVLFVGPRSMARLRMDADFLANSRALQTGMGDKGQLASGRGGVLVNGVRVVESRYVFNTLGAANTAGSGEQGYPGRKWGAHGSNVDGERLLLCGAQALAYADLGMPNWDEQVWDYDNQVGIAVGKIIGFKKPVFRTIYESGTPNEDFGLITCDVAV